MFRMAQPFSLRYMLVDPVGLPVLSTETAMALRYEGTHEMPQPRNDPKETVDSLITTAIEIDVMPTA